MQAADASFRLASHGKYVLQCWSHGSVLPYYGKGLTEPCYIILQCSTSLCTSCHAITVYAHELHTVCTDGNWHAAKTLACCSCSQHPASLLSRLLLLLLLLALQIRLEASCGDQQLLQCS
jgi:hypothetical protein